MFTGLIEVKGRVVSVSGKTLVVRTSIGRDVSKGDSIAVDGSCLTVTNVNDDKLTFHFSPHTRTRTIIPGYFPGTEVNIERSMQLSERLHGHIVTGHIDETARVLSIEKAGGDTTIWFSFSSLFSSMLVERGSVAVSGISLTVASLMSGRFSAVLIPETLSVTTAGSWKPGTHVNLEYDIIGKYIQRQIINASNAERLKEYLEQ
ncbi:MAG: riboflavin synthase [Candidatus Aegiribacteria sp.]|nr:riboflavin synthase [Candidatus Aegiribacteria sp.]